MSPNFTQTDKSPKNLFTLIFMVLMLCGGLAWAGTGETDATCSDCNTSPILTFPPNYFGCPGESTSTSNTGYATAQPGEADCPTPEVSFSDEIISQNQGCNGAIYIRRTWKAVYPGLDPVFLSAEGVQNIVLRDEVGPTIRHTPGDITLDAGSGCSKPYSWTAPQSSDICGLQSFTSNFSSGYNFPLGSTDVIYTAVDDCGNVTRDTFTVTVNGTCCNSMPTINCPADHYACPGISTGPTTTGFATASSGDTNCPDPVLTYSDKVISSNVRCQGDIEIKRTWKATDPANPNNFVTCDQYIRRKDVVPPTIHNCPQNITIDQSTNNSNVPKWTEATASDNCDTDVDLFPTHTSTSVFPVGSTTVYYVATDNCGNRVMCSFVVTVEEDECDTPPSLECAPDFYGCPATSTHPDVTGHPYSSSRTGNCNNPIVTYEDYLVAGSCAGSGVITRTWTATNPDNSSLKTTCVQMITLKDDTPPVIINCPQDMTVDTPGEACIWTEPTATDNCDDDVELTSSHPSGTVFDYGNTTVTYTATDDCGNTSRCTFNIFVPGEEIDINCPDDITVSCSDGGGAYVHYDYPVFETDCDMCGQTDFDGFVYMGSLNGHQYYCSTSKANWQTAQAICASNGGYLAVINSAQENNMLANFLDNQTAFIGMSDRLIEGTFIWVNGDPITYTNWYPGQPNDYQGSQDYVELRPDGLWNDEYNHESHEFILEIPCNNVIDRTGPPSGGYFPVGVTTVSFNFEDQCGNKASCSFTVTVESGLNIECIDDVTVQCEAGNNGASVSWRLPEVETCCGNCNSDSGADISGFMYMGQYNGSHYYCSRYKSTWEVANQICQDNGGNLVSINSAGENAFLANMLTNQNAFIGLTDRENEGIFEWTSGDPLGYTNWYPNQPNDYGSGQDYVEMLSNGLWNDQYSYTSLEFIMEISGCIDLYQTSGPSNGSWLPIGTSTICYQAKDHCGNWDECCFNITLESSANQTCESYASSPNFLWIDYVRFGSVNNHSGNDGGYARFDDNCPVFQVGQAYPLVLTPGYSSSALRAYWDVYIDYNQDGDFHDYAEHIARGSGTTQLSGTIAIAQAGVYNGETTMRVVMKYGSPAGDGCTPFKYGEVEDYCIRIVGGANHRPSDDEGPISTDKLDPESLNAKANLEMRDDTYGSEIFMAPNPVRNTSTIEYGSRTLKDYQIFGLDGKVLSKDLRLLNKMDKGIIELELSHLAAGQYFVRLQFDDSSSELVEFVKVD